MVSGSPFCLKNFLTSAVSNQNHGSPTLLRFICLVAGDKTKRAFPVDIAATKVVADLKEAIKEKKHPGFKHVPADALDLWKVSIPLDGDFNKHFAEINLVDENSMLPLEKLSAFSSELTEGNIHIIVKDPPSGEIIDSFPLFISTHCDPHRRTISTKHCSRRSRG